MKTFDVLQTASANMLRNRSRSTLTIIAIFIGAFTLSLTNAVGVGIKQYLTSQIGNLGAENTLGIIAKPDTSQDSTLPTKYDPDRAQNNQRAGGPSGSVLLVEKDFDKLKTYSELQNVRPVRNLSVDYVQLEGKDDKYQVDLARASGITIDLVAGRLVDQNAAEPEVALPKVYAKGFGFEKPEDLLDKKVAFQVTSAKGERKTYTAKVVGVQETSLIGSATGFVSIPEFDAMYSFFKDGVPATLLQQYPAFFAEFDSNLSKDQLTALQDKLKSDGYEGKTIKENSQIIFSVVDAITMVLNAFGVIALLAAALGIVNTLLMSVQERTREIGLMKALGLGRATIFSLFSIEAVLLGFWGSLLGIGAARLAGLGINAIAEKTILKDIEGLTLLVYPVASQLGIALAIMLIAFLAGTIPAANAARKDPIEALRYE
jgi:putative ABC transport system permease protein